jgi:hypothetical protein
MRQRAGSHVLISTPRSLEAIQAVAARERWRCAMVDTRLFKVVKVWVENAMLIELLTPDMAPAYVAAFGTAGMSTLDAKLRELESTDSCSNFVV